MNRKPFVFLCLLLGLLLFVSSCDAYRNPDAGKINYMSIITIDSTASACDVDSCVIKLPWLNDQINAFLKDSAERKYKFETTLHITQLTCLDTIADEQYTCFMYECGDNVLGGIRWFNCTGDTICDWQRFIENKTVEEITINPEDYFRETLHSDILSGETIVELNFGYIPRI